MSIKVSAAVWQHSHQKGSRLLLMLALADYANDAKLAWPSVPTLARKTKMSERYVRSLLGSLVGEGELVPAGIGRRGVVKYRVIPEGSGPLTGKSPEPQLTSPLNSSSVGPLSSSSPKPSYIHQGTVNKESINKLFEEWWTFVPRKVGKGQARTAFSRALKKTSFETLKVKISRYSAEVRDMDPRYIRHPTTWLNGEGWLDEPVPSSRGNANVGRNKNDSGAKRTQGDRKSAFVAGMFKTRNK